MRVNRQSHSAWLMAPLLVLVMLFTAHASAAQSSTEDVERWLDRELANAAVDSFGDESYIQWTERFVYHPPPEELARLRAEVIQRPDHPARGSLASWQNAAAGTPSEIEYRLWKWHGKSFRLSMSSGRGASRSDEVRTASSAFRMTEGELLVFPEVGAPEVVSADAVWSRFWVPLSLLADRGLALVVAGNPSNLRYSIRRDAEGFVVDFYNGDVHTYRGLLTPGSDTQRFRLSRLAHVVTGLDQRIDEDVGVSYDIVRNAAPATGPAGGVERIVLRTIQGRPTREWVLHERREIDRDEFLLATRVPSEDEPDLLRGWPTGIVVRDMRAGMEVVGTAGGGLTFEPTKRRGIVAKRALVTGSIIFASVALVAVVWRRSASGGAGARVP